MKNAWHSSSTPVLLSHYPFVFLQPKVMDTSLPGTGTPVWGGGRGVLVWGWDPLLSGENLHSPDIPLDFHLAHVGVGPVCSASPSLLLPVLMWLLLYIFSCRTSIQLDFRKSWMMAVLWFSCNSDVIVGECEYHICLCCHLDWKSYTPLFRNSHVLVTILACSAWGIPNLSLVYWSLKWKHCNFPWKEGKKLLLLLSANVSNN